MQQEIDNRHKLKNAFLQLFPDAEPGSNGNIKSFTNLEKEYHSITKGVGVRVSTGKLILKLTGNDVQEFIHRISTNDVKNLGVFKQTNTLFTNEKGRLLDRTTFLKIGDYFLLIGNYEPDKRLLSWIEKYIIMEDITVEDVTDQFTLFEFYGSQTNSFMTMMCGDNCPDLDGERITIGDTESIKTYFSKLKEVNNIDRYAAIVSTDEAINFAKFINDRKSAFDLNFIGDEVFEYFRIVNGIPGFPNEINAQFNPHEVNLIDEVSFTKGCYIGQEVIARLDTYDKVQRTLYGVKISDDVNLELPVDVINENKEVCGTLTSLSKIKFNEDAVGLVLIRKKYLDKNSQMYIASDDKMIDLELTELPIK
ncbi:MAG: hypothetical protein U5K00_12955 [Melioribacteraceae bacterium]|nr:hypothetical protein [Melioribacteraceae bacterium]